MKHTLLVSAIASALAMPTFSAQAADVILYGQAHAATGYLDDGSDRSDDGNVFASSNVSRIGVRGAEDLGAGMQAIFNIEWFVDITGRLRDLEPRQRFVGLKTKNFGTLQLGRIHSPMKKVGIQTDLFYYSQLGESRDITNRDALPEGTETLGMDPFLDNVIEYISPKWKGFFVDAAYSADYDVPPTHLNADINKYDAVSVAVFYENGPLSAAAAYDARDGNGTSRTFNQAWRFGTSYRMQNGLRLVGLVQEGYEIGGLEGANRLAWGVGSSYTFGSNIVKGQFYKAYETQDNADDGAWQVSVGLDHNLSKRTMVYATYSYIDNESEATFRLGSSGFGDNQVNVVPGADPQGFSVGIRHLF